MVGVKRDLTNRKNIKWYASSTSRLDGKKVEMKLKSILKYHVTTLGDVYRNVKTKLQFEKLEFISLNLDRKLYHLFSVFWLVIRSFDVYCLYQCQNIDIFLNI